MDAKNNTIEKSSSNLRQVFSHVFDWDDMDVTYGKIDLINKSVLTMPSNYEWYLIYHDNDLDLLTSERIVPGIQYWSNYSLKHREVLSKSGKREVKVDFCTQYKNTFDILSINSKIKLSFSDQMAIFRWKQIISYYAQRIWNQNLDVMLPLREEIPIHKNAMEVEYNSTDKEIDVYPYIRFGNIQFTRKEITTLRLLLSHIKIDEICTIQGGSVNTEYERIQRIKDKLSCEHHSSGGLLNALKEHGITLSCLDMITVYP
ncbi:hypothetical protein [Yersinia bercovieri]|uniref:hypothetical protein n=1 Tax=Yersinia bercovieri TaxID=634 RepID=UPI0011A12E21|nr:hypothetical protein [Yersinia bercovieri]